MAGSGEGIGERHVPKRRNGESYTQGTDLSSANRQDPQDYQLVAPLVAESVRTRYVRMSRIQFWNRISWTVTP